MRGCIGGDMRISLGCFSHGLVEGARGQGIGGVGIILI